MGSTLQELTLYEACLESDCPGGEVAKVFEANPLLPGIIIANKEQFAGMISRRRFFEYMSRPYSLELFQKRPLLALYRFAQVQLLVLDSKTSIVVAVRQSLQRSPELVHEPIVVQIDAETYKILDVQQLLLAQLQVHEMTTVAMRESEAQLRHQAQQLELALHELQRTQTQMIQTEKMSSLGQLVAGVAHEINNPISFIYGNLPHASNYIKGLIRMLHVYKQHYPQQLPSIQAEAEEVELDYLLEDLPKLLNSMEQGAERIRDIVLNLRNFCRLDEAQMKPVNIHEGINNALLLLQNQLKGKPGKPAIAVCKNYGDLPLVECYAGQLNQVFMNILVNAIDALAGGVGHRLAGNETGKNTEDSKCNSPTIWIATEVVEGNKVVIRITDNGPGMTEDVRMRLFDPFFTTKPVGSGTGLGLSISYEIIINQHGGELECFSEPGHGAEFAIAIPIQQSPSLNMLPRFA
ncbi:MAG TPA: ATP-binding protein [Kamptonema sp.]|nr:ATP-binding protein [Kamptonema sp.]